MGGTGIALGALATVVGALLIVYGIRKILHWMAALDFSVIFESSLLDAPRPFSIPADGAYDIWVKVPRFKVNTLTGREPEVRAANGGPPMRLGGSLFRTNMIRGPYVTMKVAAFSASRGRYTLGLVPAASVARPAGISGRVAHFERLLRHTVASTSWPKADPAECHLQVRDARSNSPTWMLTGLLPILLGAMLVVGGIVGGVLGLAHSDDGTVQPRTPGATPVPCKTSPIPLQPLRRGHRARWRQAWVSDWNRWAKRAPIARSGRHPERDPNGGIPAGWSVVAGRHHPAVKRFSGEAC